MDTQVVREMALSIVSQIERASDQLKDEWAPWALAEQVNKMIEVAAQTMTGERRPLLPAKLRQSMMPDLAVARYVDVAIVASQIAALLQPQEARRKKTA